jgi:hypothetical protein
VRVIPQPLAFGFACFLTRHVLVPGKGCSLSVEVERAGSMFPKEVDNLDARSCLLQMLQMWVWNTLSRVIWRQGHRRVKVSRLRGTWDQRDAWQTTEVDGLKLNEGELKWVFMGWLRLLISFLTWFPMRYQNGRWLIQEAENVRRVQWAQIVLVSEVLWIIHACGLRHFSPSPRRLCTA